MYLTSQLYENVPVEVLVDKPGSNHVLVRHAAGEKLFYLFTDGQWVRSELYLADRNNLHCGWCKNDTP